MKESHILHIETSTQVCSVALSKEQEVLSVRESYEDRSHGTLLTLFMEEVLKEAGMNPEDLDAIVVSLGPGSYTGLRIGVSVTKGFAFARNIPVIGIPTLKLMAASLDPEIISSIQNKGSDILLCPMIDARRMEVFTALFNQKLEKVEEVSAKIIEEDSFNEWLEKNKILFFGNGSEKIKSLIRHENAFFIDDIHPLARNMNILANESFKAGEFLDTAYFEPFYLKEFIATIPKKKVL